MANNDKSRRKCFTFIWKLENARYCWQKNREYIQSPTFVVDKIQESMRTLVLFPRYEDRENVGFFLRRLPYIHDIEVKIDYEIALLPLNGTVWKSVSCTTETYGKGSKSKNFHLWKREDVFPARSSSFRQRDTFTARCKIWKSVGEISEDVQCIARTRIGVEKTSFMWNIENFSAFESPKTYTIKSLKNNKKLINLQLSLSRDQEFQFSIASEDKTIKYSTFLLSAVDPSGNKIECLRDEIWHNVPHQKKPFSLFFKKKFIEKNVYLPNDILSLRCKCAMSFGITMEEIESISSDCTAFENDESENRSLVKENVFSVSKSVLNESFKSLLDQEKDLSGLKSLMMDGLQSIVNNGSLSDIKLRTRTQTFSAHMFILIARSPMFKAMFLSGRKQETDDYVDIKDLDDETVSRILRYIYSSEVEQLEWSGATKLYVGAGNYQILALKDICSAYLKSNLSLTYACEALVLADKQKDKNMKEFVQEFILKHGKFVINSAEWRCLMKTNLQLAAETMFLKFQKE